MFGDEPFDSLPASELLSVFKHVPSIELPRNQVIDQNILSLAVSMKATSSKGESLSLSLYYTHQHQHTSLTLNANVCVCVCELTTAEARRLVKSGGLYVNGRRVVDEAYRLGPQDAIGEGRLCLLGVGKKNHFLAKISASD